MKIEHFSVSHINDFIERRPKWFLSRVLGHEFPMGAAAHRGTAVEHGVTHGLLNNCSLDESVELALKDFDNLSRGCEKDDIASTRVAIPAMVAELIEVLHPYGKPESVQRRVEGKLRETGEIPWVGYLDLEFPEVIVDIKTKNKTPSSIPGGWRRQGAFYSKCSNKPVKFVCAVATKMVKVQTLEMTAEDSNLGMKELSSAARAILALTELPDETLAHVCFPDSSDWTLSDKSIRAAAAKVWPHIQQQGEV